MISKQTFGQAGLKRRAPPGLWKNMLKTGRTYKEDFQLNACIARTTRARIRYLDYVSEAFDSI